MPCALRSGWSRRVAAPYDIDGVRIEIGTSIGIALTPDDSVDADDILRLADLALYHSKADRGSYHFFQTEMDQEFRSKRQLEDDLGRRSPKGSSRSISSRSFPSSTGRSPPLKRSCAGSIPFAGPSPRASSSRWRKRPGSSSRSASGSCEWPARRRQDGPADRRRRQRVRDPVPNAGFSQTVFDALRSTGLPGSRLIVELTESVMMKDSDATVATLETIRAKGVRTSMDDFGTGYRA